MSLSNESECMHLTPSGWIQGSMNLDVQGVIEKDTPSDVVLTVCRQVYVGAIGATPKITDTEIRRSSDALIDDLLSKYGKPEFCV